MIVLPVSALPDAADAAQRWIAEGLRQRGFAAVPTELLTAEEGAHGYHSFDIALLARRIVDAARRLGDAPIGCFGSNVDAAAILAAAALRDCPARALVLCNARPEIVPDVLPRVQAPTLCIVEDDEMALALNRKAVERLGGRGEIAVLPAGASLGSQTTAVRIVELAADWFDAHLPR